MLNFRNTSALFLLSLLCFNILLTLTWAFNLPLYYDVLHPWTWLFYVVVASLYFPFTIVMSFFPCSGFHYRDVVCKGDQEKMQVALTFDDGPDRVATPAVLDILKENNIKAAFFLMGKKVPGNEDIVKRIMDEGHTIGNHSYEHSYWWDLLPGFRMATDIRKTDGIIEKVTGTAPVYFRPPYGVINPMVKAALKSLPHTVVAWSIRPYDTTVKEAQKILKVTEDKLHPGGIILLHERSEVTVKVLSEMIRRIQSGGYGIVPLETLINTKRT